MALVRVYCGPDRSGREDAVNAVVREHWGHAALLAPTRQAAARRAERLIIEGGLPGAWGRPVTTFQDFVEGLLKAAKVPVRILDDLERRLLLEQVVDTAESQGASDQPTPPASPGSPAPQPGFISHMLRVITQLKQAAIEPAEFRARVSKRTPPFWLDEVVADLYQGYQDALHKSGAYDRVGLFWMADQVGRESRPAALEGIQVLALDGFDDFTPSESRLLGTLASYLDLLVFGLHCNPAAPSQRDLYAIPERTLEAIQRAFAPVEVLLFEERPPEHAIEFVASNLFWRDEPPKLRPRVILSEAKNLAYASTPGLHAEEILRFAQNDTADSAALAPTVALVPCAGVKEEVEAIGRRVKLLLLDDAPPMDQVLVVYRDLREVAGAIRSVFREFGVPVRVGCGPLLTESAVCSFVMIVLDATATWQREDVVDALVSPWFHPGDNAPAECLHVIPMLARLARIVAGRDEWTARLEHLRSRVEGRAEEDDEGEGLLTRVPHAREAIAVALGRVQFLQESADVLPAKATFCGFLDAVERLLERLGLDRALGDAAVATDEIRAVERLAVRAFRDLLGRLHRWYERDQASPAVARGEFVSRLRRFLTEAEIPVNEEGVRCLDAEQARHLRFDYVFFGGLNEGEMPRPPASSAVYSDDDVQDLGRVGIRIEDKRTHVEREMLLFRHVAAVAQKGLWLSWHTLSVQGKTQSPSPFIMDVQKLLRLDALPAPRAADFVPAPRAAASWRDLRNAAFSLRRSGLRDVFRAEFAECEAGAVIERARHSRTPFDAFDGVLSDAELLETVAALFDQNHPFSADQLETYAGCPFQFFAERILHVEPVEEPVAEFDPRVRGSILHAALERFHSRYAGRAVAEIAPDDAQAAMAAALDEVFAERARWSITAPPELLAVEKERLALALGRYLRIERDRDEPQWKPQHFEVSFGKVRRPSNDPLSRTEPFVLDTTAGRLPFSGRIDRIDVAADGARIIDYKTTVHIAASDVLAGVSLQLPLYALALEQLLMPKVQCAEALLLQVGRKKRLDCLGKGKKKDGWPEREQAVREGIARAVMGIRSGRFPPTPRGKTCGICPMKGACRYEKGRVEARQEKTRGADAPTA